MFPRQLGSQHRRLACNLTSGPSPPIFASGRSLDVPCVLPGSKEASDALPRHVLPSDLSAKGSAVPGRTFLTLPMGAPNGARLTCLKTASGSPLALQNTFRSLGGPTAGLTTVTNTCAPTLFAQTKQEFCTSAGDPSATNPGDDNSNEDSYRVERGNGEGLRQRISSQIRDMEKKVLEFKELYKKSVRPQLVSRCLIAPCDLNDPLAAFLHRQTFKIVNKNPSFISCFDVMAYKAGCEDAKEWDKFLNYLVERKIYVIEDWLSSFSTVEVLMYDHGLKEPDDGTDELFYKGECDASYDEETNTASLSYIIWQGRKIIHAEVFSCINCSSPVEAEICAAMALLYKAEELQIRKLQVWCDSKTVTNILSGEFPLHMEHEHRDFYLMLRSMRSRFRWLVANWKPRELMVFVDALARAAKLHDVNPYDVLRFSLAKFFSHLEGSPVFRIERLKSTTTAVKKFRKVMLDELYGKSGNSIFLIEVEEDSKFDCLIGLNQSLEPSMMKLFISNCAEDRLDSLKKKLLLMGKNLQTLAFPAGSRCTLFPKADSRCTLFPKAGRSLSKNLVVVYDYSVPREYYFNSGDFHVLLVTPSERLTITDKLEELTALGFVYFNEIRFPLNEDKTRRERKKKNEDEEMKKEKEEKAKLKEREAAEEDLALKEMTEPTAREEKELSEGKQHDKEQLCNISRALAVLASASSVSKERKEFLSLVNQEIGLYNSRLEKEGTEGEEAKRTYMAAREESDDADEVAAEEKVSSALIEKVDAMLQELEKEIDDVDEQIGKRWQLLERDHDGKVTPEEVAAAAAYLKDTIGKEGVQELISKLPKDKDGKICVEDIVKLGSQTEENSEDQEEESRQ